MNALILVGVLLALHPHNTGKAPPVPATYSCATIRQLVALFGEAAVIAEARSRGVSEERIAQAKRQCLEEK